MRCLALNASFEPLTMVPTRRALRLVIEGKAEIVEADGDEAASAEMVGKPGRQHRSARTRDAAESHGGTARRNPFRQRTYRRTAVERIEDLV